VNGRTVLALVLVTMLVGSGPLLAADDHLGLDLEGEALVPGTAPGTELAIPDPHAIACDSCHATGGAADAGGPLLHGDDTVRLCLGCHPGANLHPVGIPPPASADPSAARLPLGQGPLAGRITCLTCHYVHRAAGWRRHLLRVDDSRGPDRRAALCAACHGERLRDKSPHAGTGEACRLCHMTQPAPGEGLRTLAANVQAICNFCHSALDNRHYLALDPFTDDYLAAETAAAKIPKVNGRFTCVSCHDPHAPGGRTKLLRPEYLRLAALSKKVNPHWKNVMCVACHEGEPSRGEPRLKEGGDILRLCYRCHAFKYSRSDIHPVNVLPSRAITLPPEMPLTEGRVTCETCHDSSLQEGGERAGSEGKRNPKFLRGGFVSRGEFCSRCHAQRLMSLLNPHEQTDSRGRVDRIKCLFCHSSPPEGQPGWVVRRQFDDGTVNELCLLCHAPRYQGDHPTAPHFVRPSRRTLATMATAEERVGVAFPLVGEKVVCITCHSPHQAGIVAGEAAAGAGKRLRVGADICLGCHEAR
jgi:predicted CXXCH cytochrome family protein